jgi:hypothetical protein
MIRTIAVAAGLVVAGIGLAAPAFADDQSFLGYLQAHGQPTTSGVMGPGQFIMAGHMICGNIAGGADPLQGFSVLDRGMMGPSIVDAAQHELCPNTLH